MLLETPSVFNAIFICSGARLQRLLSALNPIYSRVCNPDDCIFNRRTTAVRGFAVSCGDSDDFRERCCDACSLETVIAWDFTVFSSCIIIFRLKAGESFLNCIL